VGNSAGELPEGVQLFGLEQLVFQLSLLNSQLLRLGDVDRVTNATIWESLKQSAPDQRLNSNSILAYDFLLIEATLATRCDLLVRNSVGLPVFGGSHRLARQFPCRKVFAGVTQCVEETGICVRDAAI
jgi:hypothetical protein